jgi:hypothetical protein
MRRAPRSAGVIRWVEQYCLYPSGPDKGKRTVLTPEQRATIRKVFDNPKGPQAEDVASITVPLSAYLGLFYICGPRPAVAGCQPAKADIFSVWNATSPELRAVLRLDGAAVVCPELGTRYPVAA